MHPPDTSAAAGARRNLADEDLTQAVVASFDGAPTPRTREVLQSLVRHLHAFASRGRADRGRVVHGRSTS